MPGSRALSFATAGLAALLVAAAARAGPLRDAGREQVSPPLDDLDRSKSGFVGLGAYLRDRAAFASARPGGSGTALLQQRLYFTDAFNADRAKFIADLVFLSDRGGRSALKPVSLDYYLGMSSRSGPYRVRFGREEALALDGPGGGGYKSWDVRLSWLLGAHGSPRASGALSGWSGTLTAGYFLHNTDTPARLDGSGLAHLRYSAFVDGGLWGGRLIVRADADFLTDERRHRLRPADLDLSLEAGTRVNDVEIAVVRRSRESLDRPGYGAAWLLMVRKGFSFYEPRAR